MVGTAGYNNKVWYDYGKKGRLQRVYRCISRRKWDKLFHLDVTEGGDGQVVTVEEPVSMYEIFLLILKPAFPCT